MKIKPYSTITAIIFILVALHAVQILPVGDVSTSATSAARTGEDDGLGLTAPPPLLKPPTGLTVIVNDGKLVTLNWDKLESEDFSFFKVYRSKGNMDFDLSKHISSQIVTNYIDGRVEERETYYYAVAAVNNTGQQSILSKWVMVTIPDHTLPEVIRSVNLIYEKTGSGLFVITWDSSTEPFFSHYQIYLSNHSLSNIMTENPIYNLSQQLFTIFVVSTMNYPDLLRNNTEYFAAVVAVDNSGQYDPNVTLATAGPVLYVEEIPDSEGEDSQEFWNDFDATNLRDRDNQFDAQIENPSRSGIISNYNPSSVAFLFVLLDFVLLTTLLLIRRKMGSIWHSSEISEDEITFYDDFFPTTILYDGESE